MKTMTIALTTLLIILITANSCAMVEETQQQQKTYRAIITLKHRDASDLASIAGQAVKEARFIPYAAAGMIIIQSRDEAVITEAEELIKQLDVQLEKEKVILDVETRYLPVKHAQLTVIARAIESLSEEVGRGRRGRRQLPKMRMVQDERNRQLIISAMFTEEEWAKIDDIIAHMDKPFQDIEMTLKIVLASKQAEQETKLPKELKPVGNQLKKMFDFESYRVAGDVNFRGTVSSKFSSQQHNLTIQGRINKMDGPVIGLWIDIATAFEKKVTTATPGSPAPGRGFGSRIISYEFEDSLQIKDGETLIIGGSKIPELDKYILLVLSAKAVDPYK